MPSTDWEVHTKANKSITPDAITGDWNNLTRGERTRFRFWFDADTSTSTSAAYGSAVYGDTSYGASTAELESKYTEWLQLQDFLDYSDAAAYGTSQNHRPWYREQLPADATVASIVLGIEPTQDLKDRGITGVWGIVVSGSDLRNSTLTNWQIDLELFVLSEFSEYSDHADIESDLAA